MKFAVFTKYQKFADDKLNQDEMLVILCARLGVENLMGLGGKAAHWHSFIFPHDFPKAFSFGSYKLRILS